jgi:MFS family permease
MFLVCFFNFADRAVFSVLAQTIKADLGLTDLQLGLLQGLAFALLYAAFGLPIGLLAERVFAAAHRGGGERRSGRRRRWRSGLAASFGQLMLARLAVGMGEAGFTPPTASLVSDLVPRERRASTMALIMLGTPAGLFLGSVVAGAVAAANGWRAAFITLGSPGPARGRPGPAAADRAGPRPGRRARRPGEGRRRRSATSCAPCAAIAACASSSPAVASPASA